MRFIRQVEILTNFPEVSEHLPFFVKCNLYGDQCHSSGIWKQCWSILHHTEPDVLANGQPSQRPIAIYQRTRERCRTSGRVDQAPHWAEEISSQFVRQGLKVRILSPFQANKKINEAYLDSIILVKFTNSLVRSRPLKEIGAEQVTLLMLQPVQILPVPNGYTSCLSIYRPSRPSC